MRTKRGNVGFSLLEVLFALVIGSVLIFAAARTTNHIFRALSHVRFASEIAALRKTIKTEIDCQATLADYIESDGIARCPSTELVDLINAQGTAMPTSYGLWSLQAECSPVGLTVSARRTSGPSGGALRDPLTNQILDYDNPRINPILGRGGTHGLCAASFRAAGRMQVINVHTGPFNRPNCQLIKPASPISKPDVGNAAEMASYKNRMRVMTNMDNACLSICRTDYKRIGGSFVDCDRSNGHAQCLCFR